jgi:hypothetical protein
MPLDLKMVPKIAVPAELQELRPPPMADEEHELPVLCPSLSIYYSFPGKTLQPIHTTGPGDARKAHNSTHTIQVRRHHPFILNPFSKLISIPTLQIPYLAGSTSDSLNSFS